MYKVALTCRRNAMQGLAGIKLRDKIYALRAEICALTTFLFNDYRVRST